MKQPESRTSGPRRDAAYLTRSTVPHDANKLLTTIPPRRSSSLNRTTSVLSKDDKAISNEPSGARRVSQSITRYLRDLPSNVLDARSSRRPRKIATFSASIALEPFRQLRHSFNSAERLNKPAPTIVFKRFSSSFDSIFTRDEIGDTKLGSQDSLRATSLSVNETSNPRPSASAYTSTYLSCFPLPPFFANSSSFRTDAQHRARTAPTIPVVHLGGLERVEIAALSSKNQDSNAVDDTMAMPVGSPLATQLTLQRDDSRAASSSRSQDTPPRALFENFQTAYKTITSRTSHHSLHSDTSSIDSSPPCGRRNPPASRERRVSPWERSSRPHKPCQGRDKPGSRLLAEIQPGSMNQNVKHTQDLSRQRFPITASSNNRSQYRAPLADSTVSVNHIRRSGGGAKPSADYSKKQLDLQSEHDAWEDTSSVGSDPEQSHTSSQQLGGPLVAKAIAVCSRMATRLQQDTIDKDQSIGRYTTYEDTTKKFTSPHLGTKIGLPNKDVVELPTNSTVGQLIDGYRHTTDSITGPDGSVFGSGSHPIIELGDRKVDRSRIEDDTISEVESLLLRDRAPQHGTEDLLLDRAASPKSVDRLRDTLKKHNPSRHGLPPSPGHAPSRPLPADPSFSTGSPPPAYRRPRRASHSDAQSVASSYGDTRSLLMLSPLPQPHLSQASMSVKQSAKKTSILPFLRNVTGYRAASPDLSLSKALCRPKSDLVRQRSSIFEFRGQHSDKLPRSNHSATISQPVHNQHQSSVVSRHSSSDASENASCTSEDQSPAAAEFGEEIRFSLNNFDVPPLAIHKPRASWKDESSTKRTSFVPIAAFDARAVLPGLWRLSINERSAIGRASLSFKGIIPDVVVSPQTIQGQRVKGDWETVSDTRSEPKDTKSTPEESDAPDSKRFYTNLAGGQIARSGREHGHRSGSYSSSFTQPSFLPSLYFPPTTLTDYGPWSLPVPSPSYSTYLHPKPLPMAHINPFANTPPRLLEDAFHSNGDQEIDYEDLPNAGHFVNEIQRCWSAYPLSTINEVTGEVTSTVHAELPPPCETARSASDPGPLSELHYSDREEDWLSTEPGPEGNTEDEHRSSLQKAMRRLHGACSESSDTSNDSARQTISQSHYSPRHGSSDENSFAKFTRLGGKVNITGTPSGTGMREAGSSVIDSSSPREAARYSPATAHAHRPQHHFPRIGAQAVRRVPEINAPTASSDQRPHGMSPIAERRHPKCGESLHTLHRSAGRMVLHDRPAITNQRTLFDITLATDKYPASITALHRRQQSSDTKIVRPGGKTVTPILPAANSLPRLLRRYRSPSSRATATRDRKQGLSWLGFLICCLFPPLLVIFGFGFFDGAIMLATDGEIEHFGKRQKRLARWVGGSIIISAVLGLAIGLIVIRAVPNNLPRSIA